MTIGGHATWLFVAGQDRSGSTLVGGVLARELGGFDCGELHGLWAGLVEGRTCGCGVRLAACPLWSAVADPSRRRVLDLLVSHGEASASWLAGRVPFTRQAVSKHLVILEEAGLVSRRKEGREVLYRIEADRLDRAVRAMADVAAQWDRRLATIKQLAEAAHAGEQGGASPRVRPGPAAARSRVRIVTKGDARAM